MSFTDVDISDLDNDTDIDLVIAGSNPVNTVNELRLFSNDGNGDLAHFSFGETNDRIFSIDLVDINSDFFDDLIVVSAAPNTSDFQYNIYKNVLGSPSISGCVYLDENENGIQDSNEFMMESIQFELEPDNIRLQANEDGCYTFFVEDGSYTVSPVFSSIWRITSDSSTYSVSINGNSQSDLDFGFAPREFLFAGHMHAVSGITRCNRETKFDFIFQNTGTTVITEGIVWAFPDDLVSLASEIDIVDTIGVTGEWGWKFENLFPGQTIKKSILLNIPGLGGEIEPGTLIKVFSATEATDTQGFTNFFKHNYESEILCAYDPNDKLVRPDIEGDENYTQFKDTLIYTVRFQNTGNDTAFTVVIRDTLDQNLDVNTFNVLGSSDEDVLRTEILEGRFVTFTFEDILLPDSTIDFNGSQGYVVYAIQSNEGTVENTIVENTASIFFDFNPPIVTNTTENIMVECLPIVPIDVSVIIEEGETYTLPDGMVVSEPGAYTSDILDEEGCPIESIVTVLQVVTSTQDLPWNNKVDISPNPTSKNFTLEISTNESINHYIKIFDVYGENLFSKNLKTRMESIGISDFADGLYLIQLRRNTGELLANKKLVIQN